MSEMRQTNCDNLDNLTEEQKFEFQKALEVNVLEEIDNLINNSNNIKTFSYDTESHLWTVTYKNGLEPDTLTTPLIFDFLENA